MKLLYDTIFRRTSTYFVGIMASVFFFERAFDLGSEAIFDNVNRGVSDPRYIILSGCPVNPQPGRLSHSFRNNGRTLRASTNKQIVWIINGPEER